jgi:phosphoribosyl 1,2-cyclic phosphodiesterase
VQIYLCGVRGSTPSPGAPYAGVGGHTSCVALAHDGAAPTLVLDAGTGLRRLTEVMDGSPFRGTILLGHLHWDHTQGLPFFAAGDRPDARVRLLIPDQDAGPPEQFLERWMSPPFFPIEPQRLRGEWRFEVVGEGVRELEGFTVLARDIPHKGGRTLGFRVSDGTSSVAYLSDHCPTAHGPGADGLGELHPAALELAAGVDVLIHDAQLTRPELAPCSQRGHSCADYAVALGACAGAQRVLLFHHDPERTDEQVAEIVAAARRCAPMAVDAAVEGAVLDIGRS